MFKQLVVHFLGLCARISDIFAGLASYILFKTHCEVDGSFISHGVPVINKVGAGGKIVIGKSFSMNNGYAGNRIGYNVPCLFKVSSGSIFIGDNVGLSQVSLCAIGADIIIGSNTKIGAGVKIYTTDFHSIDFMDRRDAEMDAANRKCSKVSIGQDCFIGAGSIILKGVEIGDRVIVGAGSIVTKSLPSDCVAGGNPCRIIRKK